MIKLLWRKEARDFEPRQKINPRLLELEAGKAILRAVFHARPSDVEDMIHRRLEEKHWHQDQDSWQEEQELWSASFVVSE